MTKKKCPNLTRAALSVTNSLKPKKEEGDFIRSSPFTVLKVILKQKLFHVVLTSTLIGANLSVL